MSSSLEKKTPSRWKKRSHSGGEEENSRHDWLKQKPLIPNSGGTLLLEQQGTTEQLEHRALKQQMELDLNVNCRETDYGEGV